MAKLKAFLFTGISIVALNCAAQTVVDVDSTNVAVNHNNFYTVSGEPRVNSRFTRLVSGSPYLLTRWASTEIRLKDGKIARAVPVRLNLIDNEIHYLKGDAEYILERPVRELILTDTVTDFVYVFRNGYPATGKINARTLLQVMTEGKRTLLKHHRKQVNETKPYGSATTEQKIRNSDVFYIYEDGRMIPIKSSRQDILGFFSDQKSALESFIKAEGLQFKNEGDLVRLVEYYNKL